MFSSKTRPGVGFYCCARFYLGLQLCKYRFTWGDLQDFAFVIVSLLPNCRALLLSP